MADSSLLHAYLGIFLLAGLAKAWRDLAYRPSPWALLCLSHAAGRSGCVVVIPNALTNILANDRQAPHLPRWPAAWRCCSSRWPWARSPASACSERPGVDCDRAARPRADGVRLAWLDLYQNRSLIREYERLASPVMRAVSELAERAAARLRRPYDPLPRLATMSKGLSPDSKRGNARIHCGDRARRRAMAFRALLRDRHVVDGVSPLRGRHVHRASHPASAQSGRISPLVSRRLVAARRLRAAALTAPPCAAIPND